jgi:hypothetical protein
VRAVLNVPARTHFPLAVHSSIAQFVSLPDRLDFLTSSPWSLRSPTVYTPECTCFWLCTLCHELAHNLAPAHDARHAVLMERMLEAFFPVLVREHMKQALRGTEGQAQPDRGRPAPNGANTRGGAGGRGGWQRAAARGRGGVP